jgi:hypothetical protein
MPTPAEWNRLVNNKWPDVVPKPSAQEAILGARMLYRKFLGKKAPLKVIVTSGNRYTWVRYGTLYVNPDHGWNGFRGIIHLLAHYAHRRVHPGKRPHHYTELELEKEMTNFAIEKGFHLGKLKRELKPKVQPTKLEKAQAKAAKARLAIKEWEAKRKRADAALRRHKIRAKYYEKVAAQTPFTLD